MTVEISEKAYEDATAALSRGNDDLDLRGLHEAVARGMAEDAIDAAAPVILEDRVEAVAEALYRATMNGMGLSPREWSALPADVRAGWIWRARRALGIPAPDRKAGEDG